ncbi:hydrogenase maturation nickel metallochaperone HypA [Bradyrhizobium sp.]|uniref:hydrogenase maturation nickel metallochaperone HypA n=1 Tax=Bradyrhizobium sp. TaxID=376 RepID=UPI00238F6F43|nr:hydrogenase maturation nickel metallochaperone HypA [Bradyrhizobium sp.]MDE1934135.1 hydrogenase maturation nickel metallochaperone HypA [Bradyrhizobium sp.]
MHELAVCQSLLSEVERVASAHGATAVSRIGIAVGPLSGIEAPLLDRAFDIARIGTLAGEAELEIEEIPITVWCAACAAETRPTAANVLLCGRCGTWQVDIRSGNELILKQVELIQPSETAMA